MTRALLVADQDVPDLLGVEQRVVGGEHRAAGNAEHHVDPDLLKGQHQGLGPGDPDRGGLGLRARGGRRRLRGARLR